MELCGEPLRLKDMRAIAVGILATSLLVSGCTDSPTPGDEPSRAQTGVTAGQGGTATDEAKQDLTPTTKARFKAMVLWSGEIAYPLIALVTWDNCPFEIQRVVRVDEETLRVIGREAEDGCASQTKRHVTSHRLTEVHLVRGKDVSRVLVVSRGPRYRAEAEVIHVVA